MCLKDLAKILNVCPEAIRLGPERFGSQFNLDEVQQVEQAFIAVEAQDVTDLGQEIGPLCCCAS